MSIVERNVGLAADRDRVFAFVTNPDNFPAYVASYAEGRVTSEHATGPGSAFEWQSKLGPLSLHAAEQVTGWRPPEHVAYAGTLAGVSFRSRMDLGERAGGGTDLRVTVDYQVPLRHGGRAADALLRHPVALDVRRSLDALAARFGRASSHAPSPDELAALYRRRASSYDAATQLYRALGFRLNAYRRMAVEALALGPGDTVVEIGCGTGANFELLQARVGPEGRVVGVDLTDAMLAQAERRVRAHGWRNVELVQSEASAYAFPRGVSGILSSLALTHCPDYDAVIQHGAAALRPGGRWAVLDLKLPEQWPRWMVGLGLAVTKPYGVTLGAASRHPWEALERHLPRTHLRELYFGVAYLAVGHQA
jgi:demethylmenaquinone methyltransferase/2-methoxy-6-polyprenyl-1,4-benzoquinol methylase